MNGLSEELLSAAFRSGSGEFAWSKADAIEATRALAEANQAMLGGELWIVDGDAIIAGIPPLRESPDPVPLFIGASRPNGIERSKVGRTSVDGLPTTQSRS